MLIGKRIDYLKKITGSEPNVAATIRDVMSIVETDLRFRYVNFTKCHNDILEHVLLAKGFNEVARKMPALSLYLEFGASSETMINLIGMGLSRSTSSTLEPHLLPQMKVEELVNWLNSNKWKNIKELPSTSKEAVGLSKDLKKRGFKFLGPTICYAHMQAVGMVNDHTTNCFRYKRGKNKE